MEIYEKLKMLRLERGLLQKDVAKVIGVKQNTYSNKECGRIAFKIKELEKLCRFYKIKSSTLFGEK